MNLTSNRVTQIRVTGEQRSPEWHRARLGNVTGSEGKLTFLSESSTARDQALRKLLDVKVLSAKLKETPEYIKLYETNYFELLDMAGITPPEDKKRQNYRWTRVAERLTGLPANPEGVFVTYEMKWGTVNESLALAKYRLLTGNHVKDAPFLLHPTLRVGASPDGEVTEVGTGLAGVLEIKCLTSHRHLYEVIKKNKVPEEFMVQIHMEMWLSGTDFCDFVAFDPRLPGKLEVKIIRVERDDEYLNNILIPQITRFLDECDKDERYFRMMARISKEQEKLLYEN